MVLCSRSLEAALDRTKVSGPGRKVRWLCIFVPAKAWLLNVSWLAEDYKIWQSEDFSFKRDFLLPLHSKELVGVITLRAEYQDMTAMTCMLLQTLEIPKWSMSTMAWINSGQAVLLSEAVSLYTEHTKRNWLNSLAAVLGVSKPDGDS